MCSKNNRNSAKIKAKLIFYVKRKKKMRLIR